MREDFYRAFEEKYRGSRDMIKSRLKVYLPFIVPLKKIYANTEALDLGCGRGEWLELLGEEGFDAHGVDLDKGMLEACNDKNLSARVCDAVKALKEADSDSLVIVSAFHVVEHVSFEYLQNLVAEALRVLKPGGLLIMETPNPENLVVGTSSFYLDPTHQKPIPPQLLAFVPELEGFARTKILRLQESKDLAGNNTPGLNNVLDGVSPDYAVIAQKKALKKITNRFNKAFSQDYGLSLSFLAERFDNRFNQAEQKAGQAEQKAGQAEEKAGQAEEKAGQAEEKAGQAEQKAGQAEEKAGQAEQKADQAQISKSEMLSQINQAFEAVKEAHSLVKQAEFRAAEAGNKLQNSQKREASANEKLHQIREDLNHKQIHIQKLESDLMDMQQELHSIHHANHHHFTELKAAREELHNVHQANNHHWAQLEATRKELDEVHQANHHHWQLAEERQQQIDTLLKSKSWRITWPLRQLMRGAKGVIKLLVTLIKAALKPALKVLIKKVLQRQRLHSTLKKWLQKFPGVYGHLRQFALHHGLIHTPVAFAPPVAPRHEEPAQHQEQNMSPENESIEALESLTPHARRIYHDLKAAIEQRQKERN
jgi:O-antigen chain-terminating methyltransferase